MDWPTLFVIFISALATASIGYIFGRAKAFREQKQKAYSELLTPIMTMAYAKDKADETEFNQALIKLWLYGSKKVARKTEEALKILHNPQKYADGAITRAFQEVVVEIRSDIQFLPCQGLKPEDVNHLWTRLSR